MNVLRKVLVRVHELTESTVTAMPIGIHQPLQQGQPILCRRANVNRWDVLVLQEPKPCQLNFEFWDVARLAVTPLDKSFPIRN